MSFNRLINLILMIVGVGVFVLGYWYWDVWILLGWGWALLGWRTLVNALIQRKLYQVVFGLVGGISLSTIFGRIWAARIIRTKTWVMNKPLSWWESHPLWIKGSIMCLGLAVFGALIMAGFYLVPVALLLPIVIKKAQIMGSDLFITKGFLWVFKKKPRWQNPMKRVGPWRFLRLKIICLFRRRRQRIRAKKRNQTAS